MTKKRATQAPPLQKGPRRVQGLGRQMTMQEKLEMMERVQRETEGQRLAEERPGSGSSGRSRAGAGLGGGERMKKIKFKR